MKHCLKVKQAIMLFEIIVLFIPLYTKAQSSNWTYTIEGQTIVTPTNATPFWMRSDQYGSIPLNGISESFIGGIYKNADTTRKHFIKLSAGLQVRTNIGNGSNISLIEGFIRGKKGIFQIEGGRLKEIDGIVDSTLSSGAFSISGNALGIPKVQLSIPDYYYIPIFNKLFSVKGSYSLGYIGSVPLRTFENTLYTDHTKGIYEHNELYARIGRPNWKFKLTGGISHHVIFGDEKKIFGDFYTLSPLQTIIYAGIGKTYRGDSKVGNHIGSIDLSLMYDFKDIRLLAYRQNLYDVGAIAHLANIADGVNGLSLTNKKFNKAANNWRKVVFEVIYTKDQAGYFRSRLTKSGDEDYYNNGEYAEGWSYLGENLGNPLITSRKYARTDLPNASTEYFVNNRVNAFHIGIDGVYKKINYVIKLTYSKNYGTFGTSPEGHSGGNIFFPPQYGLFGEIEQFSGYIEASENLKKDLNIGIGIAVDKGGLLSNSFGMVCKIKKTFR